MYTMETLAVVGAGTMGLGIAQLGIQHGLPTILFDLNPAALEKARAAIAAGLGKLVEKNRLTPEAREAVLARRLGKTPVRAADAPGFTVNRVARHYYVESLKIVEEQAAPLEMVDELLEASGFKMGPFRLMDLIGVDTNFLVTSALFAAFHQDAKFRPSRIQQQKVDAGHHGRKTGRGFYNY